MHYPTIHSLRNIVRIEVLLRRKVEARVRALTEVLMKELEVSPDKSLQGGLRAARRAVRLLNQLGRSTQVGASAVVFVWIGLQISQSLKLSKQGICYMLGKYNALIEKKITPWYQSLMVEHNCFHSIYEIFHWSRSYYWRQPFIKPIILFFVISQACDLFLKLCSTILKTQLKRVKREGATVLYVRQIGGIFFSNLTDMTREFLRAFPHSPSCASGSYFLQ
jgi:hypothetical protein